MPDIMLTGKDGKFSAYLAVPEQAKTGKVPGIVVIQEIFGVNKVMRDLADGLAAQGYLALCPDLFWRQEPGIQITDKTEAEWKKAFQLYQGFNETTGVEDLIVALSYLRQDSRCNGKVGTIGYCLGGKLAYLMATRSNADANVSYYGVGIDAGLGEAASITKPLLLHVAEEDQFVNKEAQQKIAARMKDVPTAMLYTYPGCDHAFARMGGAHWNERAATQANQRTRDFLAKHLR